MLDQLKVYAAQYLVSLETSLHEQIIAFMDFVEGKETLKQKISDATDLLRANGFTVTQN